MPQITRTSLTEVLGGLADIVPLDPENALAGTSEDLFICGLGFEPRCIVIPKELERIGYKVRRAVYLKYDTNVNDNKLNLPSLEKCLRNLASSVEVVNGDSDELPRQLRALLDLATQECESGRPYVTIDISVTANRLIMRCMRVLLEYDICLRIVYSEARIYHPTKEEYDSDPGRWSIDGVLGLEQGVERIIPSVDHPGTSLDPMPDCVILFPSFKQERSRAVISAVDQSLVMSPGNKVIWLLGRPHLSENSWRLEAMKTINGIGDDATQSEVCTFDYKDTLRVLDRLYIDRNLSYNITVSPLGSKMQALGTAMFCYMHPDVRILLAIPKEYNAARYSVGHEENWRIDFGPLALICDKLREVGTLEIRE